MFDTLILELIGLFIIREVGLNFKILATYSGFRKRAFNPDKNFTLLHGFCPKITIEEYWIDGKWVAKKVTVDGSLRKLLWGCSYFGVDESDVEAIIIKIIKILTACGIECSVEDIERGYVKTIAYSFNF